MRDRLGTGDPQKTFHALAASIKETSPNRAVGAARGLDAAASGAAPEAFPKSMVTSARASVMRPNSMRPVSRGNRRKSPESLSASSIAKALGSAKATPSTTMRGRGSKEKAVCPLTATYSPEEP